MKATKYSAEACFRLASYFLKGKFVRKDQETAYFYFRLASMFRCKCGTSAELIHNGRVSHVHTCFHYEALKALQHFPADDYVKKQYERKFHDWRIANWH
mmetsp:Transcript_27994/g.12990  ORF Transcript_27994/g.12990 Transcript_27994/m.12990 type:complete len:99 (+) Transcript_27994:106-402(+)